MCFRPPDLPCPATSRFLWNPNVTEDMIDDARSRSQVWISLVMLGAHVLGRDGLEDSLIRFVITDASVLDDKGRGVWGLM